MVISLKNFLITKRWIKQLTLLCIINKNYIDIKIIILFLSVNNIKIFFSNIEIKCHIIVTLIYKIFQIL